MAGPNGFFKGLGARVLYSMPATAICWSTYEFFKFMLSNENSDQYRSSVLGSSENFSKSLEKRHSPTADGTIKDASNVRYVIPKPPVISSELLTGNTGSLHHSSNNDSSIGGSQYIPSTSRELPSISGVGVYTAINMNPIHTERVFEPSMRSCSR